MTRRIIIVAALGALLLAGAWYGVVYRPEASHIAALRAKLETVTTAEMQLEARYAQLNATKRRVPLERAELKALKEAVPNGPELDKLVEQMYGAARLAHVKLLTLGTPPPASFDAGASVAPSTGGPAQLQLSVSVQGFPAQVVRLVNILDAEPRLFVVDSFGLSYLAGGSGAQADTTLSVRAFYASASSTSAAS